jgi:hypothetical protein
MQGRGWGDYAMGAGQGRGGMGRGTPESYYDEILKQLPQYFQPWIGAGQRQLPGLEQQFGQLMNDPGAMYDKFAAGYKHSPGYDFQQREGQNAAMNAAAAGGMAGTPQHQQQAAQISEDIANQDFYNYISKVMGMYGMGLEGGMGLNKMGADMSGRLGEDIGSVYGQKAGMAFSREQMEMMKKMMEEQQDSSMWNSIFGAVGSIGGGLLGGPAGAAAGNWLFGGGGGGMGGAAANAGKSLFG